MKTAAIVPVKTFANAKSRLNLSSSTIKKICEIMLEEVLAAIVQSRKIDKLIVVTKDESALKISKRFNAHQIFDDKESGVNNAVSLTDNYLLESEYDLSIVFPQDIPLIQIQDVETLISMQNSPKSVLVVPSRKFDGTNALLRKPTNIMETHYDEDSYKIHLNTGKSFTPHTSLVLLRRVMFDIDEPIDLQLLLTDNEKPELCRKIRAFTESAS